MSWNLFGMQLLYEGSTEGAGEGIGVFAGEVTKLNARCVPQIGWNSLQRGERIDHLFAESDLDMAWFANSFVARPARDAESTVIAWTQHELDRFPSAVRRGHVVGAQFHPEKSSVRGVQFVRAFLNEARAVRYSLQPSKQ